MDNFLLHFIFVLSLVVLLGFFNEKITHFTYEISLLLFSVVLGAVLLGFEVFVGNESVAQVINQIRQSEGMTIESFLMDGVLCFMLFAGSCHVKLLNFKENAKIITLLSVGATLLGAVFYGLLFYGAGLLLGLNLSLPVCLMFGSITAPTDPIAATSILNKFGLPEKTGFIIEGESLLNDGVGVALFVCFSGLVTAQENAGFFAVMFTELFGAILVGLVVTFVLFPIFSHTKEQSRQVFVSLFAVAVSYSLCVAFDFSGAIASVVCGVMFSALRNRMEAKGQKLELDQFDAFWSVLDSLLNSVLYVMLGLAFMNILLMEHVLILSLVAISANLLARAGSVGAMALIAGEIPDGFSKKSFTTLLTWGGLRGGLCVALAMSTASMVPDEVYHIILGGTYALVFFTTVVQGMTMKKVYEKIKS